MHEYVVLGISMCLNFFNRNLEINDIKTAIHITYFDICILKHGNKIYLNPEDVKL